MRRWRHVLLVALVAATPFGAFLLLLVGHPALQTLLALVLLLPGVVLVSGRADPTPTATAPARRP